MRNIKCLHSPPPGDHAAIAAKCPLCSALWLTPARNREQTLRIRHTNTTRNHRRCRYRKLSPEPAGAASYCSCVHANGIQACRQQAAAVAAIWATAAPSSASDMYIRATKPRMLFRTRRRRRHHATGGTCVRTTQNTATRPKPKRIPHNTIENLSSSQPPSITASKHTAKLAPFGQ